MQSIRGKIIKRNRGLTDAFLLRWKEKEGRLERKWYRTVYEYRKKKRKNMEKGRKEMGRIQDGKKNEKKRENKWKRESERKMNRN